MAESARPEELVKKASRRFAEARRKRPDEIGGIPDSQDIWWGWSSGRHGEVTDDQDSMRTKHP